MRDSGDVCRRVTSARPQKVQATAERSATRAVGVQQRLFRRVAGCIATAGARISQPSRVERLRKCNNQATTLNPHVLSSIKTTTTMNAPKMMRPGTSALDWRKQLQTPQPSRVISVRNSNTSEIDLSEESIWGDVMGEG